MFNRNTFMRNTWCNLPTDDPEIHMKLNLNFPDVSWCTFFMSRTQIELDRETGFYSIRFNYVFQASHHAIRILQAAWKSS